MVGVSIVVYAKGGNNADKGFVTYKKQCKNMHFLLVQMKFRSFENKNERGVNYEIY